MQNPPLHFFELQAIGLSSWIQPVWILPQGIPTLQQTNPPVHFGISCKLTEGGLNPLFQITDKGIEQECSQNYGLGNTR